MVRNSAVLCGEYLTLLNKRLVWTQHIKAVRSATKKPRAPGLRLLNSRASQRIPRAPRWAPPSSTAPRAWHFFHFCLPGLSGKSDVLKGCVLKLLVFALYEFKFGASGFLSANFSKHPIFWNGGNGERRGTAGTGMEIPEIVSRNFLETPVGDPDHPDLQALIKLELLVICRPFVG